ncbi:MAG: PSD1 and planctomycete cytochrome C domain-containing protein [Pirellulaceae bacterium]
MALLAADARGQDDGAALFETKIRPVLAGTCFKCHGGEKTAHELKVNSRESLLRGGKSGAAFVAGEPENSLLLKAIRRDDDAATHMPPDKPLAKEVVADFEKWLKLGAPWPEDKPGVTAFEQKAHWAFQPVKRVALPSGVDPAAANGIDILIGIEQKKHGATPAPLASRQTLLRRLYFDLTGLPPTPEEAAAFFKDESPDAWPRLIDRLLASPRYGERWGRHWMDVARYADTAGDNADYPVPEARLYRDYIIDAFNADKPYDQFVQEQLAGDLLAQAPGTSRERFAELTIATGFLGLSRRYATGPYELWHLTLEDTVDTTGRALMGLTFRCARCHDHKFDPLTQEDYYALYGMFASTQFPWPGGEEFQSKAFGRKEFMPLVPAAELESAWNTHREELAAITMELKRLEGEAAAKKDLKIATEVLPLLGGRDLKDPVAALKAERRDRERSGLPRGVAGACGVREATTIADVALQQKGDPGQPGKVVPRGTPKFLSSATSSLQIPAGQSGRLQLAQWLTRPDHPLTARVMANRIWQGHFGKGIVGTPSNFGLRGDAPTHPELLDYLAARFVDGGWSIKKLHREILTSEAYQRRSTGEESKYYAAFDRRRLNAESIRDALLFVSGTLDLRRPGEQPFPPMTAWTWTQHTPFKDVYPSRHRSVYLMTQRLQKHPFLALFDGPDTNTTTDKRTSSTVPLQSLYWMNSPEVREQAAAFAQRLTAAAATSQERIALAYQLAYSREPTAAETERGAGYLAEYQRELTATGLTAAEAEREAWLSLARIILSSSEFVYVD